MKVKTSLTKEQKKIKYNAILASIILGATILTGCPQSYTGELFKEIDLTGVEFNFDELVNENYELNRESISSLIEDIDNIIPKLSKEEHNSLKTSLENLNSNLKNNNYILESEVENESVELRDARESYNSSIDNIVNAVNGDEGKITDFISKLKTGLQDKIINETEYDTLTSSANSIYAKYQEVLNGDLGTEKEKALYDYTNLKGNVNTGDNENPGGNGGTTGEGNNENTGDNGNSGGNEDGENTTPVTPEPEIPDSTNTFTYDDEVTIAANTYTAGTDVTIQIPATENEQPTTVNIAKLYEQYNTIAEQVGEEGSVSISYTDPANTTISEGLVIDLELNPGDVSKFKSFFNAIVPENATKDTLPKFSNIFGVAGNIYGTDIDKLFEKYYAVDASDKLEGMQFNTSNAYFDAVDYLTEKGGIAYNEDGSYANNYYDLDVNAALLMNGVAFKNVNVNGTLSKDITFGGSFTNTRFDVNSNGKEFEIGCNGTGLIEFAGDAPALTPRVDSGRLVLRNASSKVSFGGGFSIDVSSISDENAIHTNVNHSAASFTEVIYPTQETANTTQFTPSSTRVGDNLVEGNNYYATNQQWVKAANEGNWIEYGSKKYPNVSNLTSKLNLDEKNNKLLNTILYNNQKFYG